MGDSAIQQANSEFSEAWTFLKAASGVPSSVKCFLGNSYKWAKTDSKNVEFSDSWMQKCIQLSWIPISILPELVEPRLKSTELQHLFLSVGHNLELQH